MHAVADRKLNRATAPAAAAFSRGLGHLIPRCWLQLFSARELNQLISGDVDADVDVADMAAHAQYGGGFHASSRTVTLFWEVVRGFSPAEKRALLKFVTSCSRPPLQVRARARARTCARACAHDASLARLQASFRQPTQMAVRLRFGRLQGFRHLHPPFTISKVDCAAAPWALAFGQGGQPSDHYEYRHASAIDVVADASRRHQS